MAFVAYMVSIPLLYSMLAKNSRHSQVFLEGIAAEITTCAVEKLRGEFTLRLAVNFRLSCCN